MSARDAQSAASALALRLCLRGTARLFVGPNAHDLNRLDAAVLTLLAIDGPTSRSRIIELLWPEADPKSARSLLRQRLLRLRRLCASEFVAGDEVLRIAAAVETDVDSLGIDAELLEGLDFVSDSEPFARWLERERERRVAACRDATLAELEAAKSAGELVRAVRLAEQLTNAEPLSEAAHRELICAHYMRGDVAAAIVAFDRCAAMLRKEFGAAPSIQTMELLRAAEHSARSLVPARGVVPPTLLRPPRMIGRDDALATLRILTHVGGRFVVLGEAGMGKSRLLAEFVGERTAQALMVQARPGDQSVPYATLARLLRALIEQAPRALEHAPRADLARVLHDLGAAPPVGAPRVSAIPDAVVALLRAADGIDTFVIDDLHYADAATLDTLKRVVADDALAQTHWGFARRIADASIAVRAFEAALTDAHQLQTLTLTALASDQILMLLDSLDIAGADAEMAATLTRHTGGNPLFALETIKQAIAGGTSLAARPLPQPSNITTLIERRLAQLAAPALSLARIAAIAGVDFSAELAETVLGSRPLDLADAWRELELAEVLRHSAFAHDLVYEAALRTVPQPVKERTHAAIASFMAQRAGEPARIGEHWLAAGRPIEAIPHWIAAAIKARRALRFIEAATFNERAARQHYAAGDLDQAFELAREMLDDCREYDLTERAAEALNLMERCASSSHQKAWVHALHADIAVFRGAIDEAAEHIERAHALARDDDPALLRATLHKHQAAVLWQRNEIDLALSELRKAEPFFESHGDAALRFGYLEALGILLDQAGHPGEAIVRQQSAVALSRETGNAMAAIQTLLNVALTQHDIGDVKQAVASAGEAKELMARVEQGGNSYINLDYLLGLLARSQGRYADALGDFGRSIEQHVSQAPAFLPLIRANRAHTFIALGQYARAQHDLEQTPPVAATSTLARSKWLTTRGLLALGMDRPAAAFFNEALSLQNDGGRRLTRQRVILASIPSLTDPAEARLRVESVIESATADGRHGILACAHIRLAQAALTSGDADDSRAHAQAALDLMASGIAPDELYCAEAWWTAWKAFGSAQRESEAADVMTEALQWIHDTARLQVPEEFRDSFLTRNPTNRQLLTTATRLGRSAPANA